MWFPPFSFDNKAYHYSRIMVLLPYPPPPPCSSPRSSISCVPIFFPFPPIPSSSLVHIYISFPSPRAPSPSPSPCLPPPVFITTIRAQQTQSQATIHAHAYTLCIVNTTIHSYEHLLYITVYTIIHILAVQTFMHHRVYSYTGICTHFVQLRPVVPFRIEFSSKFVSQITIKPLRCKPWSEQRRVNE